jgi:hypothetical protein
MTEFYVRFHPMCLGPRRWELICEFNTFPGRPCPSLKTFRSEEVILDLLTEEGILDTEASAHHGMGDWYTVTAEQLERLEVPIPSERRSSPRVQ